VSRPISVLEGYVRELVAGDYFGRDLTFDARAYPEPTSDCVLVDLAVTDGRNWRVQRGYVRFTHRQFQYGVPGELLRELDRELNALVDRLRPRRPTFRIGLRSPKRLQFPPRAP
jgi:hypothetical protein